MKNLAKKWPVEHEESQEFQSQSEFEWNKKILVVEDEREIALSYKEILSPEVNNVVPIRSSRSRSKRNETAVTSQSTPSHFQFQVDLASNAEEAMALVKRSIQEGQPYAMGFFDVMLGPGKDGFELVKEIHEIDSELFAVFVTAYNDRTVESITQFLGEDNSGRWDYLNKPFSKGEIVQKARNSVSLWNLRKERELKDQQLADAHKRLLESEKLTSVAAVARGVNHEFGNILMQIMGKADLARAKSEDDMRAALEKILDASSRANEILERFKDLSNPPDAVQKKSWIFLHHVVNEAVELMDHQFQKHQTKICHIKTDTVKVFAAATSLLQVVINLAINSIHAMGNSGQIDYTVTTDGDMAEIRIRDYGPGVPEDLIDKVTLPFFTTKGKKGTGIGLAVCQEIVEIEHRGQFSLQNHGVKGLEVIIKLPMSPNGGEE